MVYSRKEEKEDTYAQLLCSYNKFYLTLPSLERYTADTMIHKLALK